MAATIPTIPAGSITPIYNSNSAYASNIFNVNSSSTTNSGAFLQNNGVTTMWQSPYIVNSDFKPNTLNVEGDAEFNGNVKIKGVELSGLLENIEKRLAILHPNEKLEEKWEKLKELGNQYRELEKEILHSEEMWAILKK